VYRAGGLRDGRRPRGRSDRSDGSRVRPRSYRWNTQPLAEWLTGKVQDIANMPAMSWRRGGEAGPPSGLLAAAAARFDPAHHASVLIAKFVSLCGGVGTNFAI